jgi:hypothetical protein
VFIGKAWKNVLPEYSETPTNEKVQQLFRFIYKYNPPQQQKRLILLHTFIIYDFATN